MFTVSMGFRSMDRKKKEGNIEFEGTSGRFLSLVWSSQRRKTTPLMRRTDLTCITHRNALLIPEFKAQK